MKKELLTLLATKLRENAANPKGMKFDISAWYLGGVDAENPISCGTTGCAMGLAALLPEFQALGLKPYMDPMYEDRGGKYWASRLAYFGVKLELPNGVVKDNVDAAATLFELDRATAKSLFMPDDYEYAGVATRGAEGEVEVASRIEYLVAHGESAFYNEYSRHANDDEDGD